MAKQNATEWLINKMRSEVAQVKRVVPKLKKTSVARYHIEHGIEIMAISVGINHISDTPADLLYSQAIKLYERESRKYKIGQWPMDALLRHQLFYYGRDIVLKQLKGGGR
jgi:hypothetical protein